MSRRLALSLGSRALRVGATDVPNDANGRRVWSLCRVEVVVETSRWCSFRAIPRERIVRAAKPVFSLSPWGFLVT